MASKEAVKKALADAKANKTRNYQRARAAGRVAPGVPPPERGAKGLHYAERGNPVAAATPKGDADKLNFNSSGGRGKPVAAVSVTPKKAKGSIGAASNKDLPGKTTITMAAGPKRDVAALAARSKASLADSKSAAASRGNGPGGGASTVLASLRKEKSHFTKREK